MDEDADSWMKQPWSIRIEIVGVASGGASWVCFSTAKPFLATPEVAQSKLDALCADINRICVRDTEVPLLAYERLPNGQVKHTERTWEYDMSMYPPTAGNAHRYRAVVDNIVIPAEVIRRHLVRLTLIEEY